jgi:shikimate kinase
MSYFIIIRGPLGSGKSTIARKLSYMIYGEHIFFDKVLEKYSLDKIDATIGCIPTKNFIKANELLIPEIKKKISSGKIIIFDGCFYYQEQIEHLIQQLDFPHYVFTLKAPLDVCIERDNKRSKLYGAGAAKAVYALVDKFDYGILIDATRSLPEILDEIRLKLP